jgi:hypothetical protein
MKKTILLIILTPLLFGAACNFNDSTDKKYYEDLEKDCNGDACCLTSVEAMELNGYKLLSDAGCPEGQVKNIYRCPASYQWCEPVKNQNEHNKK